MQQSPRVCVIGAGVSGLTTVKALGDWGVDHTCFEASDEVGGNWYFRNPNGRSSAYRSLHIDTSKTAVSFQDFAMDERYPDFPHHTEIHGFLREYAERFGLRERIRFNTAVDRVTRLDEGGWDIDGERFDVLVVCNGHHWDPSFPDFPGGFDGPTIHSHHYIDPTEPLALEGKRVLVVGIGNSAVDIVSELSRKGVADRVFISTRSGAWVIPKYVLGRPVDTIVKTNPRIPLGLQRRFAQLLPRLASGRMEDFGLPRPNHKFLEAHPTVSSELLLRLGSGDAIAKPDVAELQSDRVRFTDDSVEPVDAIIYATGYKITFPFFDPGFISAPGNVLRLYKRMFKPSLNDLAFVGLGQALPTIFPFAECQAKLVGRWLGGDWALPTVADMEAEIRRDERRYVRHYSARPRHTMQLDHWVYEHDLRTRVVPEGQKRAAEAGGAARSQPVPA
ncbi:MAG TPA: NAD(P)-binding domain-containing protein [Solirubrobacteraceae bacterium]|jgi:cation diffusion facilitator CzcD-associated flavoprotein CzcO|nr:NAD(P)-binding domain-containing protein [Solirubrobacteraceae bacterium]